MDSVGQAAFYECRALERLEFPVTLTMIEDNYAFCYTALTEADFRSCPKLTRVGHYAFASCNALRDVYFSAGLRSCGNCAFRNCPSLTALDFRPCVHLMEIGEQPFKDCLRLREIRFGSAVPLTGAMFTNCPALELITLPVGAPAPADLPARISWELSNVGVEVGNGQMVTEAGRRVVDGQAKPGCAMGEVEEVRLQLERAHSELAVERRRNESLRENEILLRKQRQVAEEQLAIVRQQHQLAEKQLAIVRQQRQLAENELAILRARYES
jgi:hypothetical protein